MSIAMNPRVRIAYGDEVTRGVTPPNLNLKQLRTISRKINLTKEGLSSQEIYPDRNRRDFRHGFNQVVGEFDFELSAAQQAAGAITGQSIDDWFESLLGGVWSGVTTGSLKVGTNLKTKTVERQYLDSILYEPFAGCIAGEMSLDFKPKAIIGGKLTILGLSAGTPGGTSAQGTGTFTASTTAPPMDTYIGAITEGGTTIGVATQASLKIVSGRVLGPVIGSKFSPDIFDGTCLVSGSLSAYFQDFTLLNKFLNETTSALVLTCNELGSARFMKFTVPLLKYAGNEKNPTGQGGVIQDMPFEGLFDTVSGTSIQIDRSL